jgi:NAD(P)-dependent dehydrogenase (short-subunit alcohol dehydrogenase family)
MITAAACGIGRACARMLAHQGGRLFLVDLMEEELRKVIQEIERRGGQATSVKADLTHEEDLGHIFQMNDEVYGGLDMRIGYID